MNERKKDHVIVIDDTNRIYNYLEDISNSMHKYILEHKDSSYLLVKKNISHADLISSGKNTKSKREMDEDVDKSYIEDDILYYIDSNDLKYIETIQGVLPSSRQSNIYVPKILIYKIGMEFLERRVGKQDDEHKHQIINDFANVYIVNDTMKYFNMVYTNEVLKVLGKNYKWDEKDLAYNLTDSEFTEIQLSYAIHGFGIQEDETFHAIRHSIFRQDSIIFLLEKRLNQKNLFILLEKNPKFFTLIGDYNGLYEKFKLKEKTVKEWELAKERYIDGDADEKTRRAQNKWRNLLAQEIMNYNSKEGEVFCPFTYIAADYETLGTIFRASHIKAFSDCDIEEAYDINNGLLLCANADAYFDKYLITVSEDKKIIYSFLLEKEVGLLNDIKLNQPIFEKILNEDRMIYMKEHREKFYRREEARKAGEIVYD